MTPFSRNRCISEACWPRSHHSDIFRLLSGPPIQHRLVTGSRIHQTRSRLPREGVIEAGLIAGNAGVDFFGATFCRLFD